jgi:hypothetical protein
MPEMTEMTETSDLSSLPTLSMSMAFAESMTDLPPLQLTKESQVHRGSSAIVRLVHSILKTIKFYCQLSCACVLRDKGARELLAEYCKRVTNRPISIVGWVQCRDPESGENAGAALQDRE